MINAESTFSVLEHLVSNIDQVTLNSLQSEAMRSQFLEIQH